MMKRLSTSVLWFMTVLYGYLLLDVLFFTRMTEVTLSGQKSYNLIPFATILEYATTIDARHNGIFDVNIWGNIVLFVPLGIYLMIYYKKNSPQKVIVTALLVSMLAEVLQFIFAIGSLDIDDVILNTLGAVVGVGIYQMLKYLFKSRLKVRYAVSGLSALVGIPAASALLIFVL